MSRQLTRNSDGSKNWFKRQHDSSLTWTNRQFGKNEKGGTNRRVWIVPRDGSMNWTTRQWHSYAATFDGVWNPFGETDHVIRANSPSDALAIMRSRHLLDGNDRITHLEFAGHGADHSVNNVLNLETINNPQEAKALRDIGMHMSSESEVRLVACNVAGTEKGKEFLQSLHGLIKPGRVTANDDWIALTGTGQWWTTTPEGTSVIPDERWGAFPGLGDELMNVWPGTPDTHHARKGSSGRSNHNNYARWVSPALGLYYLLK